MGDPIEQWMEDAGSLPGRLQRSLKLMAELERQACRVEMELGQLEKAYIVKLTKICQQRGIGQPGAAARALSVAVERVQGGGGAGGITNKSNKGNAHSSSIGSGPCESNFDKYGYCEGRVVNGVEGSSTILEAKKRCRNVLVGDEKRNFTKVEAHSESEGVKEFKSHDDVDDEQCDQVVRDMLDNNAEIKRIKSLRLASRQLLREKIEVNKQIGGMIHHEFERILRDRDRLSHEMQLSSSSVNNGIASAGSSGVANSDISGAVQSAGGISRGGSSTSSVGGGSMGHSSSSSAAAAASMSAMRSDAKDGQFHSSTNHLASSHSTTTGQPSGNHESLLSSRQQAVVGTRGSNATASGDLNVSRSCSIVDGDDAPLWGLVGSSPHGSTRERSGVKRERGSSAGTGSRGWHNSGANSDASSISNAPPRSGRVLHSASVAGSSTTRPYGPASGGTYTNPLANGNVSTTNMAMHHHNQHRRSSLASGSGSNALGSKNSSLHSRCAHNSTLNSHGSGSSPDAESGTVGGAALPVPSMPGCPSAPSMTPSPSAQQSTHGSSMSHPRPHGSHLNSHLGSQHQTLPQQSPHQQQGYHSSPHQSRQTSTFSVNGGSNASLGGTLQNAEASTVCSHPVSGFDASTSTSSSFSHPLPPVQCASTAPSPSSSSPSSATSSLVNFQSSQGHPHYSPPSPSSSSQGSSYPASQSHISGCVTPKSNAPSGTASWQGANAYGRGGGSCTTTSSSFGPHGTPHHSTSPIPAHHPESGGVPPQHHIQQQQQLPTAAYQASHPYIGPTTASIISSTSSPLHDSGAVTSCLSSSVTSSTPASLSNSPPGSIVGAVDTGALSSTILPPYHQHQPHYHVARGYSDGLPSERIAMNATLSDSTATASPPTGARGETSVDAIVPGNVGTGGPTDGYPPPSFQHDHMVDPCHHSGSTSSGSSMSSLSHSHLHQQRQQQPLAGGWDPTMSGSPTHPPELLSGNMMGTGNTSVNTNFDNYQNFEGHNNCNSSYPTASQDQSRLLHPQQNLNIHAQGFPRQQHSIRGDHHSVNGESSARSSGVPTPIQVSGAHTHDRVALHSRLQQHVNGIDGTVPPLESPVRGSGIINVAVGNPNIPSRSPHPVHLSQYQQPPLAAPHQSTSYQIQQQSNMSSGSGTAARVDNAVEMMGLQQGEGGIPGIAADAEWEGICPVCQKGETAEDDCMVACDACNHWFHFDCVGYRADLANDDAWFCPNCYHSGVIPPNQQSASTSAAANNMHSQQHQQSHLQQQISPPLLHHSGSGQRSQQHLHNSGNQINLLSSHHPEQSSGMSHKSISRGIKRV